MEKGNKKIVVGLLIVLAILGIAIFFAVKTIVKENNELNDAIESNAKQQEGLTEQSEKINEVYIDGIERTMTCTKKETDDEGTVTDFKVELTYKDSKIIKFNQNTETGYDDTELLDFVYTYAYNSINPYNLIDGISAKISKNNKKLVMDINLDFENLDYESLKKVNNDKEADSTSVLMSVTSKDSKYLNIETFKKQFLPSYSCK